MLRGGGGVKGRGWRGHNYIPPHMMESVGHQTCLPLSSSCCPARPLLPTDACYRRGVGKDVTT